jgi:hypothetical protein
MEKPNRGRLKFTRSDIHDSIRHMFEYNQPVLIYVYSKQMNLMLAMYIHHRAKLHWTESLYIAVTCSCIPVRSGLFFQR